jgi:hypothetical protein
MERHSFCLVRKKILGWGFGRVTAHSVEDWLALWSVQKKKKNVALGRSIGSTKNCLVWSNSKQFRRNHCPRRSCVWVPLFLLFFLHFMLGLSILYEVGFLALGLRACTMRWCQPSLSFATSKFLLSWTRDKEGREGCLLLAKGWSLMK